MPIFTLDDRSTSYSIGPGSAPTKLSQPIQQRLSSALARIHLGPVSVSGSGLLAAGLSAEALLSAASKTVATMRFRPGMTARVGEDKSLWWLPVVLGDSYELRVYQRSPRVHCEVNPVSADASSIMIAVQESHYGIAPPPVGPLTVRLLGPVDIICHRRELDVGPPQRRAVLAALAVDANKPVPVEVLVRRVWGGFAPDGARAALHAHIARLRRVLAQPRDSTVRLTRRNGGYVLDIDPDDVDLHRFQRLLSQAHDPRVKEQQRIRRLQEVLATWRGQPLAGAPGDWARRVRAGAETQLIGAAVTWARLASRSGRIDAVIDRLSQLASLYPSSEPLAAALMRALCTVGRQAEALQHYAATRIHLREELGASQGQNFATCTSRSCEVRCDQPV